MTTSSYHFLLGRSLLLLMGFNESTGVVTLDSGKLTRCQIQNPETRPRNLTGRWQEGLRVTTEMQSSDPNLRNKFCPWKGICQAGLPSRSGIGQSPDPIEVHAI